MTRDEFDEHFAITAKSEIGRGLKTEDISFVNLLVFNAAAKYDLDHEDVSDWINQAFREVLTDVL